jgi:hypothetical protein
MDVTLDHLFDGVTGAIDLRDRTQVTELEFARELARVAGASQDLIHSHGFRTGKALFEWTKSPSHLPPLPTMLERFVRECRCDCSIPVRLHAQAGEGLLVEAAE